MLKMKIFLAKSWIQLCLLLWCIIMCLCTSPVRIMGTEKREVTVFFNNYGTLMDFSSVPKCESGGKINLLEYNYGQMECPSVLADDCTTVRNDALLPEEELLLHEECSLLDICTTLWFPTRLATLENKINAMTIKFQCTNPNDTFLDICEKRNSTFSNTLHLTLGDRTHFRDCRCWVNQGTFTALLNDIRLTQKKGSECSPAELVIGDKRLSCNGTKQKGFRSVFHEKNKNIPSVGLYVSLISTLEDISPDMVWLIIHPHETCHIECEGDKSSQQHAPSTATTTSKVGQNTLTSLSTVTSSTQTYAGTTGIGESTACKSESTADISDIIPWIIITTFLLLIVIGLLVYQIVKRKTSKQKDSQKSAKDVETTVLCSSCNAKPDRQFQIPSPVYRINEQPNEEAGQHQNGINALRSSQHLQQSKNTNRVRGTHLGESVLQPVHQQGPQQKIAERKYSQGVAEIFPVKEGVLQPSARRSSLPAFTGGHNPQRKSKMYADFRKERKRQPSSGRQISSRRVYGINNHWNNDYTSMPVMFSEESLSDDWEDWGNDMSHPLLKPSLYFGNALAESDSHSFKRSFLPPKPKSI